MSDELEGERFGGALEELRRAARINLPRLALQYSKVTDMVAAQSTIGPNVLARPAYFQDNGIFGPLHGGWTNLQGLLENALGTTTNNYVEVSELLDQAIDAFCEADEDAAKRLDELRAELQAGDEAFDEEFTDAIPEYPTKGDYEDFQTQHPEVT